MATNKLYESAQVSMVFMGVPITSGYAEGEFLTIEQVEDDYKLIVGTDGSTTRSATNNRAATITVKLMQSSDGNGLLSAINNLDRAAKNGAGVGPMLALDRSGTAVYSATKCWISKPPDVSFDMTAKSREWTLMCADLTRFDGGN